MKDKNVSPILLLGHSQHQLFVGHCQKLFELCCKMWKKFHTLAKFDFQVSKFQVHRMFMCRKNEFSCCFYNWHTKSNNGQTKFLCTSLVHMCRYVFFFNVEDVKEILVHYIDIKGAFMKKIAHYYICAYVIIPLRWWYEQNI